RAAGRRPALRAKDSVGRHICRCAIKTDEAPSGAAYSAPTGLEVLMGSWATKISLLTELFGCAFGNGNNSVVPGSGAVAVRNGGRLQRHGLAATELRLKDGFVDRLWTCHRGGAFPGKHQGCLAHRETIVAGKHQMQGGAVRAHPFRGEAGRISRPNIPAVGEVSGRPRTPRLGRVVNGEAAMTSSIEASGSVARSGVGNGLHKKIPPQCAIVGDSAAIEGLADAEN